jgi:hypothetical protein
MVTMVMWFALIYSLMDIQARRSFNTAIMTLTFTPLRNQEPHVPLSPCTWVVICWLEVIFFYGSVCPPSFLPSYARVVMETACWGCTANMQGTRGEEG